jgi:hypothetical protein
MQRTFAFLCVPLLSWHETINLLLAKAPGLQSGKAGLFKKPLFLFAVFA